ncbi:MAG: carboxypeptidase regulatory-like domain-containing protein [Acidobacteriota bacterium]
MTKQILKFLLIFLMSLNAAPFLISQQGTTCSLSGVVKDSDNNPISKATIILEGSPLLGMIIYVTEETGKFHFANLPPGENYSLHVEKPEYQIKKYTGIHIDIGEEIKISAFLEKDPEGTIIVIENKSPALDTTNSNITVRYSSDFIQSLPLHKDLFEIMDSVPGSVSENPPNQRGYSISGGSVRGNRISVDGVVLNDPLNSFPLTSVSVDTYGEIEFGIAGHSPEVTDVDGGYLNIVPKSGGDQFRAGFLAEYYNKAMQSSFLSEDDLDVLGLSKPTEFNSWNDLSFHLGGPIAKDIVNLYVNLRYSNWIKSFYHKDWASTQDAGEEIFVLDEAPHQEFNLFGKVTTRLPLDIGASLTYNLTSISEDVYTYQNQNYLDQTATNKREGEITHLFSFQGNYSLKSDVFFEGRVTYLYRKFPLPYSEQALSDEPRHYDRYFHIYRNNPEFQQKSVSQKLNPSIIATYFNDSFLGAEHKVKLGLEYEWSHLNWEFWRENPFYFDYYKGNIYSYPTELHPNRGKIYAYTSGSFEGSSVLENESHHIGGFFQESLSLAHRLTLNLGVRFDFSSSGFPMQYHLESADPYGLLDVLPGIDIQYKAYNAGSKNVMRWFSISPRVGIVFDIFGDGKTSLSGTYSKYHESMAFRYFNRVSPIYPQLSSWYWYDDDFDQEPDADDTYTLIEAADNPDSVEVDSRLDPKTKPPLTDEYSVGLEQEINPDLTIMANVIYKHKKNILENVNDYGLGGKQAWKGYSPDSPYWEKFEFTDPGDDGIFGTEDDLDSYCYVELEESPGNRHWYYTNIESAFRKYTALQLVLNKRMSNRWQLLASVVWSKAWGNIGGYSSATSASSYYFDTPNSIVNAEGRLDYDRPLNIKIQGSVVLPYGFDMGCYYHYQAGIPWNRTVTVYVPEDDRYLDPGASYTVATEERGTRRTPAFSSLDFRLQKKFKLTDLVSVQAYVDVLNALGGTPYSLTSNPGGYVDYRDPDDPTFERYGDYIRQGVYNNRIFKIGLHLFF